MKQMNAEIEKRIQMIKENKVPEGYKRSKVGIIPNEWGNLKLDKLISNLEGGVSVNSEEGIVNDEYFGVLKTGCVFDGRFNPNESKRIKKNEVKNAKVRPKKDRIIINRANAPELVGSVGLVDKDYENIFLSDKLWQTEYSVKLKPKWLNNFLCLPKVRSRIKLLSTGTSKSMQNISKESFLSINIMVPEYKEQEKIAEVLTIWDKAINLKQKLISEKEKQKEGLCERLLTGKVRLKGFKDKWEKVKLGKLIIESKECSIENNQHPILSVTKEGIFLQNEYFKRQIASENNIGYKIVKSGNLVFSSMNLWMGSIDVLTNYEIGIVSPACKVFFINEEQCIISYMKYLVKSSYMINLYKLNSEQGASVVRRNLDLNGLLASRVKLPKLEEQKQIATILTTADKEIDLLKKELNELKDQKKGLMQLLLTGIVRVKCD